MNTRDRNLVHALGTAIIAMQISTASIMLDAARLVFAIFALGAYWMSCRYVDDKK